ncbi:MAG TPA: TonB-dependent receptor, partial [Prosthecobacter sp.]
QAAISYDITPDLITYFTFAGGFKAGGFNAGSPAGTEAYAEERSWNYELGLKGRALNNKLRWGAAAFYTDWRDLQLNVANGGPATFHIANAGNASARGIEIDLNYAPTSNWSIFGSAGWTDTKFNGGARDNIGGASTPLGGRQIPYTPDYTAALGTQVAWEVGGGYSVYGRAEVQFVGSFNYDTSNTAGQDAYTIANFRLGVRNQTWFLEGFVNNAFDAEYVPIAFGFPGIAPSGYVGESGTPITFGVRTGIKF